MIDLISRQAVENAIYDYSRSCDVNYAHIMEYIDKIPSVSKEKTGDYVQGWHDAITTALKETHNVYTEDGPFRVVQEETLIGVGMAYEQEPKIGRWEWNQYDYNPNLGNWHCSKCGCIAVVCVPKKDPSGVPLHKYCPNCGAKMEVEK